MNLETALVTTLKADATISGIVGARVYPAHIPQSQAQPAIFYRVITWKKGVNLSGADGSGVARIEVGVTSPNFADVVAVSKALMNLLGGFSGTLGGVDGVIIDLIEVDDLRDDYEHAADGSDTGRFLRALDLCFYENEPS